MAIPTVSSCCNLCSLKSGGCLLAAICIISWLHLIFDTENHLNILAYIAAFVFVGVYAVSLYGIVWEKIRIVQMNVIWKCGEMLILTVLPIVDIVFLHSNTLNQALIIAWALNAYYTLVTYSLYKEMEENGYEELMNTSGDQLINEHDVQTTPPIVNNTLNMQFNEPIYVAVVPSRPVR